MKELPEYRIHRARRTIAPTTLVLSVLLALVVGAGVGVIVGRATEGTPTTSATGRTAAGSGSGGTTATTQPPTKAKASTGGTGTTATTAPPPPLGLASLAPTNGASDVPAVGPFRVTFSAALSPSTPTPTISPPTPGRWQVKGDQLVFAPTSPIIPLTLVTIRVPGGSGGVRAADGAVLSQPVTDRFRVQDGSIRRLQQLLSLLAYSPLAFAADGPPIGAQDGAAQLAALYHPPAGTFSWRQAGWPTELTSLWKPGAYTSLTKGLVMSFQADHGLTPNGGIGPELWSTMLSALSAGELNHGGYDYALADKTPPESLTVYHDGAVVLRTPANSGIATSPTPDGTFIVYTRLRRQVMRGTNPNGAHYADLVQYIAYFHGNDAVHYMPRADYGIPQSLGCIELPLAAAAKAWPYLAYGTLVTVRG